MFEYILGLFALLAAYKEIKFFIIRRRIKGPTEIIKGTEPFFYKRGKVGALLIHGFTSSPAELRELGEHLAKENITCYCPLLPGHGTTPERLSIVNWYEWIEVINDSIELLKESCNKIYFIGNSFGGNIAFYIADKHKETAGVIAMGTPIKFKKEKLAKTLFIILKSIKLFQRKYYPKKYRINSMKKHLSYKYLPLKALTQVLKIIKESKNNLTNIKCPLLLINSRTDMIVDNSSVHDIFKNVKSKIKKVHWVPDSYHVVLADKDKKRVIKEISKFIEETKNLPLIKVTN